MKNIEIVDNNFHNVIENKICSVRDSDSRVLISAEDSMTSESTIDAL